jgi:hypothetical protein
MYHSAPTPIATRIPPALLISKATSNRVNSLGSLRLALMNSTIGGMISTATAKNTNSPAAVSQNSQPPSDADKFALLASKVFMARVRDEKSMDEVQGLDIGNQVLGCRALIVVPARGSTDLIQPPDGDHRQRCLGACAADRASVVDIRFSPPAESRQCRGRHGAADARLRDENSRNQPPRREIIGSRFPSQRFLPMYCNAGQLQVELWRDELVEVEIAVAEGPP